MMKLFVSLTICLLVLMGGQASASHDTIYSPCGTAYGYIHMTYDEWAAHITTMEADGTIPSGMVFRYNEELHGGKGLEDPRVVWARNLTDGQILSIDDWANGDHPKIEELNFSAGLVPEWILDANRTVRRFNDPYWAQANPLTPTFTVWQSLCMGNYGYSIPVMEINDDGVWESNIPTTTTQAIVEPVPSPVPSESSATPEPERQTLPSLGAVQDVADLSSLPTEINTMPTSATLGDYDLFDAEWDGYPFEQTILLLEERYPPNTPGKYHFRLSVAVEYLRAGGMVKGLDNLWDSGG